MHHSTSTNKHKEDSSDNYTKHLEIGDKKKNKMQNARKTTHNTTLFIENLIFN
jgi:hypothetical protein